MNGGEGAGRRSAHPIRRPANGETLKDNGTSTHHADADAVRPSSAVAIFGEHWGGGVPRSPNVGLYQPWRS